jgi:hypothetical protein
MEDKQGRWAVLMRIERREAIEDRMTLDGASDVTRIILRLCPAIYNQKALEARMAVEQLAKCLGRDPAKPFAAVEKRGRIDRSAHLNKRSSIQPIGEEKTGREIHFSAQIDCQKSDF